MFRTISIVNMTDKVQLLTSAAVFLNVNCNYLIKAKIITFVNP
jgi:hypothetical protein